MKVAENLGEKIYLELPVSRETPFCVDFDRICKDNCLWESHSLYWVA